jgi:hypothetical protein
VSEICDTFIPSVLENQKYKAAAFHAIDFDVPLYNVWKQQEKTAGGVSASFASSDC